MSDQENPTFDPAKVFYLPPPTVTRPRNSFARVQLMAAGVRSRLVRETLTELQPLPVLDVPCRGSGDEAKRGARKARIRQTPRALPLAERKQALAAKCRVAGEKSPMALSEKKKHTVRGAAAPRPSRAETDKPLSH